MTARPLRVAMVLALLLALAASQEAGAGAPTDQLRAQIDKVLKTVEDPELKKAGKANERREAVRRIGGGFHRYSVDSHWLVPHATTRAA